MIKKLITSTAVLFVAISAGMNKTSSSSLSHFELQEPESEVIASGNEAELFNEDSKEKFDLKPEEKTLSDREEYQKMTTTDLVYNQSLITEELNRTVYIIFNEENENMKKFLYEIAIIESRLGTMTTKYTRGGTRGKGVWQVERVAFKATKNIKQHPELIPYIEKLKQETGIDWTKTKWEDCNYVFYCAVAAQLYLIIRNIDPADTTALRAAQWKKYYNTYKGKGRKSEYIRKVGNYSYYE